MRTRHFLATLLAVCPAVGGARESADYAIVPDAVASGGGHSGSADYAIEAAIGGLVGICGSGTAPEQTAKHGYIGQLYEVTGLVAAADPSSISEGGTSQLAARASCDDGSWLALAAADVVWTIVSGPLTGISAEGLATAGWVYATHPASARLTWGGLSGDVVVSVVDADPDNYGSYAGDGLDDGWQQQYFGSDNPLAAPAMDPDGDGQDNRFEFTAGLVPTNPLSRFLFGIAAVPGQAAHRNLVFEPLVPGRTYTVEYSYDLDPASWAALPGNPPVTDAGNQRTVTDTAATGPNKFYRVNVTKP